MNRVKLSVARKKRYKRILKLAKGFRGRRKNCIRIAKIAVRKAKEDAYVGRKEKKRYYRRIWNVVIGIWAKQKGTNYSQVIGRLIERFQSRKNIYEAIRGKTNEEDRKYLKEF